MKTDRLNAIAAAQIALAISQEDARRATSIPRKSVESFLAQVYRRRLADLGGLPA